MMDQWRCIVDNKAIIGISINLVHHNHRKQAKMDRHFTKWNIEDGTLLQFMKADLTTKALARIYFKNKSTS